ncbi:MAG TPA: NfeD family protein [Dokdonella sp.]|uniref:NfeD family protein n=1 Tax=Dokdonella sp. TaxID=2291710 RepID=UPI002D80A453|nr:NfeD family protein [Dokdonella sp.]HET9034432.1 NfeD family protein [Dokdonella sp.]
MESSISSLLASYGWWLLALLLIAAEMITPGYFLLWIGLASAVMGLIMLAVPGLAFLAQAVLFALLSIALCFVYWKYIRPAAERRDDQPLLNRKGDRMIGRRVTVVDAIVNGRGKAKVGDSVWLIQGEDCASGTSVTVTAVIGTTLQVVADPQP